MEEELCKIIDQAIENSEGRRYIVVGNNFSGFLDDLKNRELIANSNIIYDSLEKKYIKNRWGKI